MSDGHKSNFQETDASNSDSESVEEDAGHISKKKENQFLAALVRIRKGDKQILEEDLNLFDSSEDEEAQGGRKDAKKKSDSLTVWDVQAKRLMEDGADAFSTSDEEEEENEDEIQPQKRLKRMMYDEKQQQFKSQFLEAAGGDLGADAAGDFGGFKKIKGYETEGDSKEETKAQELLEQLFDKGDKMTKDDRFLKDFLAKQQWIEADGEEREDVDEGLDLNEDERFLEEATKFETAYNFRFEEPGSSRIVSYPRNIESSVRRKESKRKRQRQKKEQRVAEKETQNTQLVKTQKNIKKREIRNTLSEISSVAGGGVLAKELLKELLQGDFDMDEWDKRMLTAYGDDYYAQEDDAWADNTEEQDIVKNASMVLADEKGKPLIDEAMQEAASKVRTDLQSLLQDYYSLDHEDNIDGIKCRFKYISVQKDNYGLKPEELICLDDKELNSFVGPKRLDPYRDDATTYKVNPYKLRSVRDKIDFSKLGSNRSGKQGTHQRHTSAKSALDEADSKNKNKPEPSNKAPGFASGVNAERLATYSRDAIQPKNKKIGVSRTPKAKKKQETAPNEGKNMGSKAEKKNQARKRARLAKN